MSWEDILSEMIWEDILVSPRPASNSRVHIPKQQSVSSLASYFERQHESNSGIYST